MVKCLNGGPGSRPVIDLTLTNSTHAPPTTKCKKFLKADYRLRESVSYSGEAKYLLRCPVCGVGPDRSLTFDEYSELERYEAEFKERYEKRLVAVRMATLPRGLDAKKARKEAEKVKYKIKKDIFGEEAANKWLEGEKVRRAEIKLGIPTTPFSDYIKKALPSIYFAFGGLVTSAFLGSPIFFFAALAFGFAALVPSPESISSVHKEAKRIKFEYQKRIAKARRNKADPEEIRNIIEEMKAETEVEKLLGELDKDKLFTMGSFSVGKASGVLLGKEFLRVVGFILLIIGLLANRVIPFAGLVGLIVGFVAYFSFGTPERKVDKEG